MDTNHTVDQRILELSETTRVVHISPISTPTSRLLAAQLDRICNYTRVADEKDLLDICQVHDIADLVVVSDSPSSTYVDAIATRDFLGDLLLTRGTGKLLADDLPAFADVREDETYFTFGEDHPDKVFILCGSLGWNSGLFAEYLFMLDQIVDAYKRRLIPIIDWQTSRSNYAASEDDFFRRNPFNYFFNDVAGFSVDDALTAKHVIITHSRRPRVVSLREIFISQEFRDHIRNRFSGYYKFSPGMNSLYKLIERIYRPDDGRKILGVHARGMEFRLMSPASPVFKGHQLQPSIEQVIEKTEEFLGKYDIGKILFASEDQEYCKKMLDAFGDLVAVLPMNNYQVPQDADVKDVLALYPRKNTLENIASTQRYVACMTLLAKSHYFISGNNSGSAYVATRGEFEEMFTFDVGSAGSAVAS
jgi:hypothetical protein